MKLNPNLTKKELQKALKLAEKEIKEWSEFAYQVHEALHEINKPKMSQQSKDMVKAGFPICYEKTHCKSCVAVYKKIDKK